jgi:hypothetical protein
LTCVPFGFYILVALGLGLVDEIGSLQLLRWQQRCFD